MKVTPYELWNQQKPDISHIRTFGCATQILTQKPLRGGKFELMTRNGILLGFFNNNYNFKLLGLTINKIIISHDADEDDDILFPTNPSPTPPSMLQPIMDEQMMTPPPPPNLIPKVVEPWRSTCDCQAPD
ncbi:hypothetical protein CROQUDRAFT_92998 [Cronartium quercuum f. sp. fusiforme G11]|uniref:Uncharacterized protein n=1 Tax=Cronartium quercuum f. sp. fusiforme G11 TaxID=708437 RepID=A0A9P6TBG0_9BASI|nr:hypothetical protein CROQUDRAFT_92998 [Cronartium quercuum f. sp. fusiforme G11]